MIKERLVFVTKIVITAAGKGTRLLPFTKEMPKEMMPIFSKLSSDNTIVTPLLQYIFEQLYSMGFRDYCFIVRKEKKSLQNHFKIHKSYLGIVMAHFNKSKGTLIDDLFYYEGKKKIKTRAITHFTLIDSKNNYSLLKLNPETGRKHQLRKQLLIYGNPILGDEKYNISKKVYNKKRNLMLHAHKIHFMIDNYKYNFTADLPEYFKKFLKDKSLSIYKKNI